MPRLRSLFVASIVVAGLSTALKADETAATWLDPGWKRVLSQYHVTYAADGSRSQVYRFRYRATDERGARSIAQARFDYNSYFDTLSVDELRTIKSDGRIIPVDARAVLDQPRSADISSPYIDESRVRMIAYQDVGPGDEVEGRVTYTSIRPEFAGEFTALWTEATNAAPGQVDITIEGPAAKPLKTFARDAAVSTRRSGDRVIYRAVFAEHAPQPPGVENAPFDTARRFEVSTFEDYPAFLKLIGERNAPMAVPDADIRAKADEIVGDATTPQSKVERIHNWIAQNVRYVGIGFEDGGFTSQPASATLAARYGDCKAHATLLKAMLAAVGIDAHFVLVNAGSSFTLTTLAMPSFDHAIVFVPELNIYLDPTASLVAFGSLPLSLYGKPAADADRATISVIPNLTADRLQIHSSVAYTLKPDGTRQAQSDTEGTGVGAFILRAMARSMEGSDRRVLAEEALRRIGWSGQGSLDFANPRPLSDTYLIRSSFDISSRFDLKSPHSARLFDLDRPGSMLRMLAGSGRSDFACRSFSYIESGALDFPKTSFVVSKPSEQTWEHEFSGSTSFGPVTGKVFLSRSSRVEGHSASASASFTTSFSAPICPQSFAGEIEAAIRQFDDYVREGLELSPTPPSAIGQNVSELDRAVKLFDSRRYDEALPLLRRFAEAGEAPAQRQLGRAYQFGTGIPVDLHKSFYWYSLAAKQNDAAALNSVGYMHYQGVVVPLDYTLAAKYYQASADQEDPWALVSLGNLYRDGLGVKYDRDKAIALFRKAAEKDYMAAWSALGWAYELGTLVDRDDALAFSWYRKAADAGDAFARDKVGARLLEGRGVPRNYEMARDYLVKAATAGQMTSQYNLGYVYEAGLGVPVDLAVAAMWYERAAHGGHQEARIRLRIVKDPDSQSWLSTARRVWSAVVD